MAEGILSAAERQALVDRRLDEIDRALLGLLPRTERLEIVASVEARVQALGDAPLSRETAAEATNTPLPTGPRTRAHRSRLAFSSGVLGIVAVSCLIASPLLLIGLSIFGELLGETFSILLFALLTALVALGGGLAVCGGGVSLFRLARRGQSATGTGWAITGLCTGALPLLIGCVGAVSLLATVMPAETVQVTWNASTTPVGAVPCAAPGCPMPMMVSPYGYAMPAPLPPGGQPTYSAPSLPAAYPGTELAAQPKAEPTTKPEAEAKPEPKPELQERPSLPLDESAELED
jgi:hypothetical protein